MLELVVQGVSLVVELLISLGHVEQHLAGGEGGAVRLLEPSHGVNHLLGSHGVAVSEGAAGEWREAQSEDGADISLDGSAQDSVLVGVDGLVHEPEQDNRLQETEIRLKRKIVG